jgi:ribosomal protein S18 acetylase RimI-like enzyme
MVNIRKMKDEEFWIVVDNPDDGYAEGMAKAQGISLEEAKKSAKNQIANLLPDGINTKDHFFYSAESKDQFVGYTWVNIKPDTKNAWGYNIFVLEEFRRSGVAKEIFNCLQVKLKEKGVKQVSFHVYADNTNAISLYEQNGFEVSNIVMKKEL